MAKCRYTSWFLLAAALSGCFPYPRFAHVYKTPQYTGLFVNRQHQPVPNVVVDFPADSKHRVQTGPDGRAVLPARRSFQVIGFFIMDPPRMGATVRATWPTSDTTAVLHHLHQVPFYSGQKRLTVAQDTIELPLP